MVVELMYVGEALVGEGSEVAHIDLVIGDRNGPVGEAFVNSLSSPSIGHTPLLGVIRPNLMPKPPTLIVPKVTVKNMDDASKIFGPAQTAVSKAIADAVEEGIIPKDEVENLVVVVSVFIHPDAKDYARIFRYNYGATKLALKRAMEGFPDIDTVLEEKDRDVHPIMGYKLMTQLFDPPYLQIAIDIPEIGVVKKVLREVPTSDHVIFEAGTPLIKKYGLNVITLMREVRKNAFIVADLKTLDTGNIEARMAADATADEVVVSGLAPKSTIEKAIMEAKKTGIYSCIDMLNVDDPVSLLKSLSVKPDVVELHRAIDEEQGSEHKWGDIEKIKKVSENALVAVAGGITIDNLREAIESGADIIIVGRAITKAGDIRAVAEAFLDVMRKPEVDQFRVKTDF
jgi:bifunctional enzyme Fae/Hps